MPKIIYKILDSEDRPYLDSFSTLNGLILTAALFKGRAAIFARMDSYGVIGEDYPMRLFIAKRKLNKRTYTPKPEDACLAESVLVADDEAIEDVAKQVIDECELDKKLKLSIVELMYDDSDKLIKVAGSTIYELSELWDRSMSSVIKFYEGETSMKNYKSTY